MAADQRPYLGFPLSTSRAIPILARSGVADRCRQARSTDVLGRVRTSGYRYGGLVAASRSGSRFDALRVAFGKPALVYG